MAGVGGIPPREDRLGPPQHRFGRGRRVRIEVGRPLTSESLRDQWVLQPQLVLTQALGAAQVLERGSGVSAQPRELGELVEGVGERGVGLSVDPEAKGERAAPS